MYELFSDFDDALDLLQKPTTPFLPNGKIESYIPIEDDPYALFTIGLLPTSYTPTKRPVFSSEDLSIWGPPQSWGYEEFEVVEMTETVSPLVMDFKMESERRGNVRPVHRYSRRERFIVTAKHLLGCTSVPAEVLELLKNVNIEKKPWESVRARLKLLGCRRYYNSIPFILRHLGVEGVPVVSSHTFIAVVNDFMRLSDSFDRSVTRMGRKYFPNIRFVVLKLFDAHGITFGFEIPKVRTMRKKDTLEEMWKIIY